MKKKINPILASIEENLHHVEIIFQPTNAAFKQDRENTGNSKELTVKEFLEAYLDRSYTIQKGKIYRLHGAPNSIDCVVLGPLM